MRKVMKLFKFKNIKLFTVGLIGSLTLATTFTSTTLFAANPVKSNETGKVLYNGQKSVKYVFLLIGDGMAATQIDVARKFNEKPLALDKFSTHGTISTRSTNSYVTDSAAAATALACGKKTFNGMLGVDAKGKPLVSIAEKAKKYSKRKVGIISTVCLNHATPAAFYAKTTNRGEYYNIGIEMLNNANVDFFGGGGFNQRKGPKGDLFDLAKKSKFKFINTKEGFNNLKNGEMQPILAIAPRLVGPVTNEGASLPKSIDYRAGDISLAEFTAKGIEVLDNKNGFFMMIEGGQIDWSCHENDGATMIKEMLAFDDAIKVVYEFAKMHPDETLIVVCGDHETGGMKMGLSGTQPHTYREVLSKQKSSAQEFNKKLTAVASKFKPTKNKKVFNQQFEEVMNVINDTFNTNFTASEKNKIKEGFTAYVEKNKIYGKYNQITVSVLHILNKRAGFTWSTFNHTATPTSVFAEGKGAEIFAGAYRNDQLAIKLMSILGVPAKIEYK